MGDHLIRKTPGFQPILYKFIIWAFLGLSPYLFKVLEAIMFMWVFFFFFFLCFLSDV